MLLTKTGLQVLGIQLCLVIFLPSLTAYRSLQIVDVDGRLLDISLLSQECASLPNITKHNVPSAGLTAPPVPVPPANNMQNMTSVSSTGQIAQNFLSKDMGTMHEPPTPTRVPPVNTQVPCQLPKTQLVEFGKKLNSVLKAIRQSVNRLLTKSHSGSGFGSSSGSGCFFPFVTTAQEIHNYTNALFQAQQDGERYFQNLNQSQNAELLKRNQSHTVLLHRKEIELKDMNCQILTEIQAIRSNIASALLNNESLHMLSARRLEAEGKFKSTCALHLVGTEIPDEVPWDPRPMLTANEFQERTESSQKNNPGFDDISGPLFHEKCLISPKDLQTIQIVAEESTQLIIAISQNKSTIDFRNITIPEPAYITTTTAAAQCGVLLKDAYSALQELYKNKHKIPAYLRQAQEKRIANIAKAHSTKMYFLNRRFIKDEDDLKTKYRVVRTGLHTVFENLTSNFTAIDDQNFKFKYDEIREIRKLARNLITCNKSASAAQTIHHFYCGLKTINESVPSDFDNFTHGINLNPLDITDLENCQNLTTTQIMKLIQENIGIDNNPEICELAWRVRNGLLTVNNTEEDQSTLELIIHEFPKNIHELVFSTKGVVAIGNKEGALIQNESGNLCTTPINGGSTRGKIQKWKVHFIQNGRYISFENEDSGKLLFEDTDKRVRVERDALDVHRQQWEVSTHRNGSTVRIRNRCTGNLLSSRYLENC